MLQRSGALTGKSANYNKIAKAVSSLSQQGVHIAPLDINKSDREFKVDAQSNTIYFGLLGAKGLKEKVIDKILELRPFDSLQDFIAKTGADITSIVALIKGGAFDCFGSRMDIVNELVQLKADLKSKLNGQNLLMIAERGLWPKDTNELEFARRAFAATKYMTKLTTQAKADEYGVPKKEILVIDDKAKDFLDECDFPYEDDFIWKEQWKTYYDVYLRPIKDYLIEHQEEMLDKVNSQIEQEFRNKYFKDDNISMWEIEVLGLCFGEHPMRKITQVSQFEDLPAEPEIAKMYPTKQGRMVPLYKLTMIAGIAIAKDKLHSTVTVLTATGPVEVKFRKQQFASYDAQISKVTNGKKQVVEKSWFNRGNMLLVHGMRQDDQFIAKTYKNSPMKHTAYKITEILDDNFKVQKERKAGKKEESDDENN